MSPAMLNHYTQFKGANPFGSQAKMLYHLDRLQEYVETGDTTPVFVEFSLTDRCNLGCNWCISGNCRGSFQIDKLVATQFLSDFKRMGGKAVTFSGGGEPTLHPDFLFIAEHALVIGLDVGLMTNGVYPATYNKVIGKFKWVRFSVDTVSSSKYVKWKGVDKLDNVFRNITWLQDEPVKVGLNVNICMEHTLEDIQDLIHQIAYVDYIQFRPVLPRYFNDEPVKLNEEVWEYLEKYHSNDPKINLSLDKLQDLREGKLFQFNSCEGHFFNPVVHANGDVSVCMYHPRDENFTFGNLNKSNFKRIWLGVHRQEIIERVRRMKYCDQCQICCKLTELNKFLSFVNTPDLASDINFL